MSYSAGVLFGKYNNINKLDSADEQTLNNHKTKTFLRNSNFDRLDFALFK